MSTSTSPLLPQPPPASPSLLVSYWRLTRLEKFPVGNILIFWPCAWGLAMAAYSSNVGPETLALNTALFLVGSTLLHSAACVINDICDRKLDRLVERTKNRPLASGAISVPGAVALLFALLVPCVGMLFLCNDLAFYTGLFGIVPLHALYPLMKRWTYWPQAWLGLAMNWGLIVSWISLTGSMNWDIVPFLFASTWAYTMCYDTIYGCQDKKDDVKAGIKSTSLLFGNAVRPILSVFAAMFVAGFAYGGHVNGQGPAYFIISVGGSALHFTWQMVTLDFDNPQDCWEKFVSNGNMGYIPWAGMLVDYYLHVVAV